MIDGSKRKRRNGAKGQARKRWYAHYRAVRFAGRMRKWTQFILALIDKVEGLLWTLQSSDNTPPVKEHRRALTRVLYWADRAKLEIFDREGLTPEIESRLQSALNHGNQYLTIGV